MQPLRCLALMALLLPGGCALLPPVGNPHVPQPAQAVALPRYLGIWYEQARYEVWFERGCEQVTGTYTARPDGLIGVANACLRNGRPQLALGRARVVVGSGGAKLKVSFFGPFFFGNYWVLDHDPDYRWSIVGDPSGRYLWLLTRDRHPPTGLVAAMVARASRIGYATDTLHMTRQ